MKTYEKDFNCPVEATIAIIGGKYKSIIIWHLIDKTLRFNELRKLVPQSTPKMMTNQLRELEADGIVHRKVYPVVPPKVEYSLTEYGVTLTPIIQEMFKWGNGFLDKHNIKVKCSE